MFGFRRNRLPVIFRIQFPAQNVGHRPIRAARIAIGPDPIASYRNRSGHFCGETAFSSAAVEGFMLLVNGFGAMEVRCGGQ